MPSISHGLGPFKPQAFYAPAVPQKLPAVVESLAGTPTGAKIDSDVYVPLIGQITRGADVSKATKAADSQINAITGCKS